MEKLREMQKKFGKAISQPLDEGMVCPDFISDGPQMAAWERMEIYQRLYWYRLFHVFYACYPFLSRLFGYEELHHKIIEPYFLKYPPHNRAINRVGDKLSEWLEENYLQRDKQLVMTAANLDLAYELSYFAPAMEPIKVATEDVCLQSHIFLFKMPADFFSFREAFLKESIEYWTENPFPQITYDRTHYFVLFRSDSGILYEEICDKQYAILSALPNWQIYPNNSSSCLGIDDPKITEWFYTWTCRGWLCDSEKKGEH